MERPALNEVVAGSRFDKLDIMFMAFLCFALVIEAIR